MAVSLEQFNQHLAASRLMSTEDIAAMLANMSEDQRPQDGEKFARMLVRQKRLTAFQAQQIYSGKGKSLVLGNYVVLDKLGQGGMGMVLKAEHRRMERIVALKVLSPTVTKSAEVVRRFHREVKAAAKLDHPNIVTAYDADEANGTHFLVMQFVDGIDLSDLVQKHGRLPLEKAVACIMQAARGLAYAHQRGVIHRDIKPSNLLLDREGTVKVLDMGLARLESAGADQDQITGTGQIMGTVDYMAPEQAMDTKHADARADIYSLGATLWYLLTGRAVFVADTAVKKLMAHQTGPIPSLRAACPEASPELEAVFTKMVAKAPESRQQSMLEVVADLERCAVKEEISALNSAVAQGQGQDVRLSEFLRGLTPPAGRTVPAKPEGTQAAPTEALAPTVTLRSVNVDTDPETQQSLAEARPLTAVKAQSRGSRFRVMIVATLLAVLVLLGAIIYHIQTNRGTLVKVTNPAPPVDFELDFDGTDDHVDLPSLTCDTNKPITLEGWVTPFSAEAHSHILVLHGETTVAIQQSENAWHGLRLHSGALQMLASPIGTPMVGRPTHLALVWDGARQHLFVDGKGTSQETMGTANLCGSSGALLGCVRLTDSDPSLRYFFRGRIDELRVSNSVRYEQDFTPAQRFESDNDTLALYHFDEGQADKLIDSSGHNHHGQIVGARWVRADGRPIDLKSLISDSSSAAPPLAVAPFDAQQARAHQDAWANYLGTTVETTNSVGAKMILIPPGEFWMGSSDDEIAAVIPEVAAAHGPEFADRMRKAEQPQHPVVLSKPFWMGATEVTIGQFRKFAQATQHQTRAEKDVTDAKSWTYLKPGYAVTDESPAAAVTRDDALAYCRWLSEEEQAAYRLPTEAEWEFACRAGTTSAYYTGDVLLDSNEWSILNSDVKAHPVATKRPNPFGLFDMHGNLTEWCQDRFDEQWYVQSPATDPVGPETGAVYALRGGNWDYNSFLRSAYRMGRTQDIFHYTIGFRVVRELDVPATAASVTPRPATPVVTPPVVMPAGSAPAPVVAVAPFDAAQARAHQEAWAQHLGTTVETINSVDAKMVLIPPGEFLMGSTDEDVEAAQIAVEEIKADQVLRDRIKNRERPQHRVVITQPFLMGATEVTIREFKMFSATGYVTEAERAVAAANAASPRATPPAAASIPTYLNPGYPVTDDSPAAVITWNDALAYCKWLSEEEQTTYRLPTEAEWEYACRAGTTTQYSFGDKTDLLDQYGWYSRNASEGSHAVGTKLPNPFGLFDMHGSLWEWCGDFWDEKWYERSALNDPIGPTASSTRVFRGGAWFLYASHSRSAFRGQSTPDYRHNTYGFRVVRVLNTQTATLVPAP